MEVQERELQNPQSWQRDILTVSGKVQLASQPSITTCHISAQRKHSLLELLITLLAISCYAAIYERVHKATDQSVILVELV